MNVLILDNYDSFTWNLVHGLESAGAKCSVYRSDAITVDQIRDLAPARIVLSPGPFGPDRTGTCPDVVRSFRQHLPLLGICLGMQVMAAVEGAKVIPSSRPVHGKASLVSHDGLGLFRGLPNPFAAARYHSLIIDRASIPGGLQISAWDADGTVLGLRQIEGNMEGIMFHPESFLTEMGPRIFSNFMEG